MGHRRPIRLVDSAVKRSVVELFVQQVQNRPDHIAVIGAHQSMTYAELHDKSNQLAHLLQAAGVRADTFVGLCVERSVDMAVALWGILKAGGAYLPLDPYYPAARLAYMVEDSRPQVVLSQPHLQHLLPDTDATVLCLDTAWEVVAQESRDEVHTPIRPDDLAYVMYTSGSTGKPKGVLIPHRALVAHAQSIITCFDLTGDDRILQFASLSFDVAAEELFPTWGCGASVILAPPLMSSFLNFHQFLRAHGISVLNLPTPYWHEWVRALDHSPQLDIPECVRLVVVGSDKVSPEHLLTWRRRVGDRIRWLNAYGLTEATITSTVYEPSRETIASDRTVVSIGCPLDHVAIYLLDDDGQIVPTGEVGQLAVGGEGLARGYLNQPGLTLERFHTDPFQSQPQARLYYTGDLARFRPDGNLEFCGRTDEQLKIRGFRIERGEIEAVLNQHHNVVQSIVVPYHEDFLVGYLQCAPHQGLEPSVLHHLAAQHLPHYMQPQRYVFVEAFPLTPNGKVDYNALPEPTDWRESAVSSSESERPLTDIELKLVEIWRQLLKIAAVGIHANFFNLGGHSLLALRLMSGVASEFGVNLPISVLVESPTIAELAIIIEQGDSGNRPSLIVPLQPHGNAPPLFLIHADGSVLFYRPLALQLSAEQPVYGVQAPRTTGVEPISLEARATLYLNEIRQLQPHGPYYLGGYSMGGLFAYEIAQQLVEQGESVGLVAIIDGHATYPDTPKTLRQKVSTHLMNVSVSQHGVGGAWRYLKERGWERCRAVANQAKATACQWLGRPVPQDTHYLFIRALHRAMTSTYTPKPYPGRVTLMFANHQPAGIERDDYFGWPALAEGGLDIDIIAATHHSLMIEPHVQELGQRLQARLDLASPSVQFELTAAPPECR